MKSLVNKNITLSSCTCAIKIKIENLKENLKIETFR